MMRSEGRAADDASAEEAADWFRMGWVVPGGVVEAGICPRLSSLLQKVDCSTALSLHHLSSFTWSPETNSRLMRTSVSVRPQTERHAHWKGSKLTSPLCFSTCDEQNVSRTHSQSPECCPAPQHHLPLNARLVGHHDGRQRDERTRRRSRLHL